MAELEHISTIINRVMTKLKGGTMTEEAKVYSLKDRPVSEVSTKDQTLKDIAELIPDLITKITENVDETQEKASFTIKVELSTGN